MNTLKTVVKQPEISEATIWHTLMLFLSKIIHNHFLKPTVITDPKASLAYEAQKLSVLRTNGFNVPKAVYLILENCGEPLWGKDGIAIYRTIEYFRSF